MACGYSGMDGPKMKISRYPAIYNINCFQSVHFPKSLNAASVNGKSVAAKGPSAVMVTATVLVREALVDDAFERVVAGLSIHARGPCTGNDTCCGCLRSHSLCTSRRGRRENCRNFRDPYNCRDDLFRSQCCHYRRHSAHSRHQNSGCGRNEGESFHLHRVSRAS